MLWDADLIAESAWVAGGRPGLAARVEELIRLAQTSAYATPRPDATSVTTALEASRALRAARTPLIVLVENVLRDGAFLRAALELYRISPLCELIERPPVPPAVRFDHVGGAGDFRARVVRAAAEASRDDVPLRLIAVRDSDRDSAESEEDPSVLALREVAAETPGAYAHVWSARAAENYLPDSYWQAYREGYRGVRSGVDDLLSMSPEARDFVAMGQSGKGWKQVAKAVDEARPYHLERFARVLPTRDEERSAWVASLRERDRAGDLDRLFDRMENLR